NHDALSWTMCYTDSCITHISSKEGANWFPQGPRKQTKDFNVFSAPEAFQQLPVLEARSGYDSHFHGDGPPKPNGVRTLAVGRREPLRKNTLRLPSVP